MSKVKTFLAIFLWSIIAVFVICFVISCVSCASNKKYTVTYESIKTTSNYVAVNFKINPKSSVSIDASDFSAKIGGNPISANYVENKNSWEFSIGVSDETTVVIIFEHLISTFDTPIVFYYKGTELPLGEAVTFKT